jgi:molybdopterin synthase catalytic subunit
MSKVRVFFFATLRSLAGRREVELEVSEAASVAALKARLAEQFPEIAPHLAACLAAVNREYTTEDSLVRPGDELALFPPVSGGVDSGPTVAQIVEGALDLDGLLAQITLPSTGAACVFTGMVRGVTRGMEAHDTSWLEYEAYQPMAEAKLRQVAGEIRARWPSVEGIALVQRVGRLLPGTPTVLIACTAAHRDTGVFEAARYGIDRLKEIVPVWKKEVGPNGEMWVEGDYHPAAGE